MIAEGVLPVLGIQIGLELEYKPSELGIIWWHNTNLSTHQAKRGMGR